ncbi:MAG: hypothetical protein GX446_04225 [Chthonomonadales bacterium]|nr:hypothetical protein [Chthonomonadales bacterium]
MADALFTAEFRQACSGKGCPFCRIARGRTRRYLSTLLYEYATAPDIHRRLAETRGFCHAHAWMLQHIARAEGNDGLGVAILYATVVQRLRTDLGSVLSDASVVVRPQRCVEASRVIGTCLACSRQQDSENYTLSVFLEDVTQEGFEGDLACAYEGSDGACRPHFEALMAACTGPDAARWLAERFLARLTELADHLNTYMRKHQVEHRGEPMGGERDSWIRAIELCAGARNGILRQDEGGTRP